MPEPQYLLLYRHAETDPNVKLKESPCGLYYSNSGSDLCVPLTANGQRQSDLAGDLVARFFAMLGRRLARAYHGDFLRVVDSLDRLLAKLPYDVPRHPPDKRLNKRSYGMFWNLTRKGVEVLHPDEWARYLAEGDFLYRAPAGGQNYPDLFAQVDEFYREVITPSDEDMLVATHSINVLAFLRLLEGLSDQEAIRLYEEMAIGNAAVLIFERANKDAPWQRYKLDENVNLPLVPSL